MFRPIPIAFSAWAISASQLGVTHPIAIAAFVMPWFLYEAYVAMITADDRTLDAVEPANTIIIFDLHGVLFKANVFDMIKVVAFSPCAWRVFISLINPLFLYDIIKMYYHNYITEYIMITICKKYTYLQPCLSLFLRVYNLQIPNWQAIEIVQDLKARGYTLHLLSNIGENLYADLESQYPNIFQLFDATCIGSKENRYIGKPDPLVFYNYIVNYPGRDKMRLLIDDRARNIAFARAFNIAGIHFKSASGLRKWLTRHGIL
jgi:FMN phosphatase YigB (HAD superfamily)